MAKRIPQHFLFSLDFLLSNAAAPLPNSYSNVDLKQAVGEQRGHAWMGHC